VSLRLAILELAASRRLAPAGARRLLQLAGVGSEPARLPAVLPRAIAVLAAVLGGFGVLLWVAASWADFGRGGRFALLQALVFTMGIGAWWLPRARAPLGLAALLAIGGLFAYFGQTYQTGADAWQLFALWAAIGLPLALAVRSDVVWVPWAVVATTGIVLWSGGAPSPWRGHVDVGRQVTGWAAAIALVLAAAPAWRRVTGAGPWAMRTAAALAVCTVTLSALVALFGPGREGLYVAGLAVLVVAAVLLALPAWHDLFALSAVALGLDTLVVGGLARWLFGDGRGDWLGTFGLLGLLAAGVLAATVQAVMRVAAARRAGP